MRRTLREVWERVRNARNAEFGSSSSARGHRAAPRVKSPEWLVDLHRHWYSAAPELEADTVFRFVCIIRSAVCVHVVAVCTRNLTVRT